MKKYVFILITIIFFCVYYQVQADTSIDSGLAFLISKQDDTGKITGGYGATSQWAAIAFIANNQDVTKIKKSSLSLKDFLLTDIPEGKGDAAAWASRILAWVAIGENPSDIQGKNYVAILKAFMKDNQMGDISLLNDDYFGILALLSSGNISENVQDIEDMITFILDHQSPSGGFSYDSASAYGSASDMTAAAIQSLVAAKNHGFINSRLDPAIEKAKEYLFASQKEDGGFGYDTSDADTTSWVLQAFNVLQLGTSDQAIHAKQWLLSSQQKDGGFPSWDGSNTVTTSHSLIALAGRGWLLSVYGEPTPTPTPLVTQTPIPTFTPAPTMTPTPTPNSASNAVATPTQTPTPTFTPTPTMTPTPTSTPIPTITSLPTPPLSHTTESVLGTQKENMSSPKENPSSFLTIGGWILIGIGSLFLSGCGILFALSKQKKL